MSVMSLEESIFWGELDRLMSDDWVDTRLLCGLWTEPPSTRAGLPSSLFALEESRF